MSSHAPLLPRWLRAGLGFLVVTLVLISSLRAQVLSEHSTLTGDVANNGYFGGSVCFSGQRLAVGTSSNKLAYVYERTATGWQRQAKFAATFPNNLTSTVCLDGDTLVVANEIYVWDGTAWTLQFTLPIATNTLVLQGDTLVAGDASDGPKNDTYGADGAIYVFTRSNGVWAQQAKLKPSPAGQYEGVGYTVALDGDTLVAGSYPFSNVSSPGTYVFTRSNGTWTQQARLTLPAGSATGWALALDGDTLALGDPQNNSVHFFRRNGSTWSGAETVTAPDSGNSNSPYHFFSSELALDGDTLVVLSDGGDRPDLSVPWLNAHLFSHTASGWVQTQLLRRDHANAVSGTLGATARAVALGVIYDYATNNAGTVDVYDAPSAPTPGGSWQSYDIGATALAGSDSDTGGTITVRGSGADIWDRADAFHFRAQTFTGDGTLVARVANPGTGHPWAKIGLMMRAETGASSANVLAFVTPGNHLGLQTRAETSGLTTSVDGGWIGFPAWLMLDRVGDTFRAYHSYDGDHWTALGTTTAHLPATLYWGLAVTSHDNTVLQTATFDNVVQLGGVPPPPTDEGTPPAAPTGLSAGNQTSTTVQLTWVDNASEETGYEIERAEGGHENAFTLITTTAANVVTYTDSGLSPNSYHTYRVRAVRNSSRSAYSNTFSIWTTPDTTPGWTSADVGSTGLAGGTSASGNAVTLTAGGNDIWDQADGFRFYYQALTGDGVITARVAGLTPTHPWAKAGVMIRETLTPGSANAAMLLTAQNVSGFQTRATTGALTDFVNGPWVNPVYWVRLTRVGNVFTGYVSPDGATWTLVGSRTIPIASSVYIGLAASAHTTTATTTATFDQISLPSTPPPPPPPTTAEWSRQIWGGATGNVTASGNTITVTATGDDLWNAHDSGLFARQTVTGDKELVAKVDSFTATHAWAKAGLMFRAANTDDAANIFVGLTPANGAVLQVRTTSGASTTLLQQNWTPGPGSWLKLARSGDTFRAYFSTTEGATWTLLGTQTLVLPTSVEAGFAVSSHDASANATAAFSQISLH